MGSRQVYYVMPPTDASARQPRASVAASIASSTMGTLLVGLSVTPLDVVKVRMQAHVCPVGGVVPCADPRHVGGMADAMRKIVRTDGVRGLWRGLNATLAMAVPTTAMYFTIYEAFMAQHDAYFATRGDAGGNGGAAAVAGAAARLVTATVASPVELARVRIQAGAQGSVVSILRDVHRNSGLKSLWRGLGPTLIRDAPFSAIYWSVYETLKDPVRSPLPRELLVGDHKFGGYLCSGVGAGSLAAIVTVPADVVKTRRQAAILAQSTSGATSTLDISRIIVREEGLRGLFRGIGPRVVKVAPSCAIMMGSYECTLCDQMHILIQVSGVSFLSCEVAFALLTSPVIS
jgi:solute carrier family 25, member 39/40